MSDVRSCLELINDGQTYEVCLTNRFKCSPAPAQPKALYSELRKVNPGPYGAWLSFGAPAAAPTPRLNGEATYPDSLVVRLP